MSEEQLAEIYRMLMDMPEGAPAKTECHILLLELRRTRSDLEAGKKLVAALVQVTHEDNAQEVWDEVEALRLWAGLPKFKFPDP